MNVTVVGLGYVGLPLAVEIAKSGMDTLGYDIDALKIEALLANKSHIPDVANDDLAALIKSGKINFTSSPGHISLSDVVIICVPTPLDQNRNPDITYVESAAKIIGRQLKKRALIINESTSFPGTLRNIIKATVDKEAGRNLNHLYAISPERVDPGNETWHIKNTPRLYAGIDEESTNAVRQFYGRFCDNLVELSSPEAAEAAKLFENTFRQVNIALVNEFSIICNRLGLDVNEILDGAATKPYGFMKFTPGIGVGGHCIPVDPTFLSFAAKKVGAESRIIDLANAINFNMPNKIIEEIEIDTGFKLDSKNILIVGLAYKQNINDVRESASVRLIEILRTRNNTVEWYDPLIPSWNNEKSVDEIKFKYDLIINVINHEGLDYGFLKSSPSTILDFTGKTPKQRVVKSLESFQES